MTGGNPKTTGIYYDVEPQATDGARRCVHPGQPATGGDVIYDSPDDKLASVNDFINPANGTFPSFDETVDLRRRSRHQPGRDYEVEEQRVVVQHRDLPG